MFNVRSYRSSQRFHTVCHSPDPKAPFGHCAVFLSLLQHKPRFSRSGWRPKSILPHTKRRPNSKDGPPFCVGKDRLWSPSRSREPGLVLEMCLPFSTIHSAKWMVEKGKHISSTSPGSLDRDGDQSLSFPTQKGGPTVKLGLLFVWGRIDFGRHPDLENLGLC